MVTKEILSANPVLAKLEDDAVEAILAIYQNAENAVIGNKTKEIYDRLDADILEASGIAKNGSEKTYDYAKRVARELSEKAKSKKDLKAKIENLESEKARLEKVISENKGNEETTKELERVKAERENFKNLYTVEKEAKESLKSEYDSKLTGVKIDSELSKATAGVKFKKEYNEAAAKMILSNVLNELKTGYKHDFTEDGKMLFLDPESGLPLYNKENQLNPFTASDLVMQKLKELDVLCTGRTQGGGGTNPQNPKGGGGGLSIDLSGAKTQFEAAAILTKELVGRGYRIGTEEFAAERAKAWEDNGVSEFPEN